MHKIIFILFSLSVISIEGMDIQDIKGTNSVMENDKTSSLTPYEKMKLELKKEKVAIMKEGLEVQKRKARIKELDFLSRAMGQTLANNVSEMALFRQMFIDVSINDIFFENFKKSSESLKDRVSNSIEAYKKILANKRQVPIENVFDEVVQEEAEYKEFVGIFQNAEATAKRMMREKKEDTEK